MAETGDVQNAAPPVESLRTLLAASVDYAGLFPPASLPMTESIAEYARTRSGCQSWMLGRLVAPATRLRELQIGIAKLPAQADSWPVSATASNAAEAAQAADFSAAVQPSGASLIAVKSVELRARDAGEIARASATVPPQLDCFFEIPLDGGTQECAEAAREAGRCLKARCGGPSPENVPSVAALAAFIRVCVQAGVRFKLTAGLHHPLRGVHTADDRAAGARHAMHGFLNVFIAAAFARAGAETERIVEMLDQQSSRAFRFDAAGVGWRNKTLNLEQLKVARHTGLVSFGSCSFREPLEGLRGLGLL